MVTQYPLHYAVITYQLSAFYSLNYLLFVSQPLANQLPALYSNTQQTHALQSFGCIKPLKQSSKLNANPASLLSLAMLKLGRQLIAALNLHKDACLTNSLGSTVMNDSQ